MIWTAFLQPQLDTIGTEPTITNKNGMQQQHTAQTTLPNGLTARHRHHQLSSRFYFERGGTAGNRNGCDCEDGHGGRVFGGWWCLLPVIVTGSEWLTFLADQRDCWSQKHLWVNRDQHLGVPFCLEDLGCTLWILGESCCRQGKASAVEVHLISDAQSWDQVIGIR